MDKVKIGAFIAKCRKEKGITQEQLAEELNVTNKAVSKWETGNCLPDASLYEPLCSILGISISELFAGCRIREENEPGSAKHSLLQSLIRRLYEMSDKKVSFDEFANAMARISEISTILKSFETKADAVSFLTRETGFSQAECTGAYDFYTHLLDTGGFGEVK